MVKLHFYYVEYEYMDKRLRAVYFNLDSAQEDILNHMKELDEVQNSDEWITLYDAAKLLNVSHGTIVRRMTLKLYTKRKVNGLNYLNKNEVLTKNTKNIVIPEGFISRTEAAKLLGVSRQSILNHIKKSKYITKEIDGKIFLSKESVMNSYLTGLSSKERILKGSKIGSSQKWQCTKTGYITTSGALSHYQKARGIDTSQRVKLS